MRLRPVIATLVLLAPYPTARLGLPSSTETAPPGSPAALPEAAPADAPPLMAFPLAGMSTDAPIASAGATPPPPPGEPEAEALERILVVSRGDTLARLLDSAGIDDEQSHAAIGRLSEHFRPTSLRPGDEVAIRISTDETPLLLEIEVEPEPGRTVRAHRQPDGSWLAEQTIAPRTRFLVRVEGAVDGGLFPALTRAGLPAGMALSLIRILGHQVDFQRDLKPGDSFAILFERFRDSDGDILGHGQVIRATLTLSGRTIEAWRHKDRNGGTDWYDQQGRSLRRSFLRTPLDGARISSGFGLRSHPVLGFNRLHQGIDFAAPTGTPVYAAADGTIVSAKREGGYGLMVRIRHAGGVETRYAHLSRFGRSTEASRRVRQGDVIGAVGSTGLSTGPHLHYEVATGGHAVDPSRHVPQATRLTGAEFTAFRTRQRTLDRLVADLGTRHEVALAGD